MTVGYNQMIFHLLMVKRDFTNGTERGGIKWSELTYEPQQQGQNWSTASTVSHKLPFSDYFRFISVDIIRFYN